jgi:hypothetical protein
LQWLCLGARRERTISSCTSEPAISPSTETASAPLATRFTHANYGPANWWITLLKGIPASWLPFQYLSDRDREANPIIPSDATTMPPGFPMKIPIYFEALWSTPSRCCPMWPSSTACAMSASALRHSWPRPGWLKYYRAYAGYKWRTGAEIVDYVAVNYSVSPRLLLALLEYKSGALSDPNPPQKTFVLDYEQPIYRYAAYRLYTQLYWAANTLNNGYYGWRSGKLRNSS